MRYIFLTGVSLFALAMAAPAFAGQGQTGGDDSATITQSGETSGYATQHQPGVAGDRKSGV